MVYTKVTLFYGFFLSAESHGKDPCFDNEILWDALTEAYKKHDLEIYSYPCCSELNHKGFLIGKRLCSFERTYPHGNENCDKCEKYTMCDKCLGTTTNGEYDVNKALNTLLVAKVEVCDDALKEKLKKVLHLADSDAKVYITLDDCLSCT